ncbi:ribonuclease H-like domain-containing protein [Tanacetum coccineum]
MGPIHNNTLNELLSKLLQQLGNLNVSGSSTSHGSTSHGPSGVPVAYHSGPYGYYAPSLAQPIRAPPGFSYQPAQAPFPAQQALDMTNVQPTQPDSSCHMDTSGQATVLPYAFTTVNSLGEIFNTCMYSSVLVGDGHSIPVTNTGHSILPTLTRSLHLNNVLITPHIVKNLIYVCQFVRDNNCTIEFDAFGFFVKDFLTRRVLLRCDITGDLYQATTPSHIPYAFLVSQHMWHQRLGHPGGEVLRRLVSSNFISYNKEKPPVLCHACQLGKHVRLSFVSSNTMISSCFDNIHSDVWTSPIPSLLDLHPTIPKPTLTTPTIGQTDLLPHKQHPAKPAAQQSLIAAQQSPTTAQPTPASPSLAQLHSPVQQPSSMTQHTPVQLQFSSTAVPHQTTIVSDHHAPTIVQNPPVNPNSDSVHPMVTRFRVGTNRLTERLNLHVSSVSPLSKSYRDAFNDPNWQNAMRDEYIALIKNKTWTLVPRPPNTNSVHCMWIFRHKYLADGTLSRYKARLVANDSTQLEGVDVDETFSSVVKPGTIRTVLSLAASPHWPIHQLDVKNAFLHGDLFETVYMHQPLGFWDYVHPDYIGIDTAYLLLYVNDIVLTASSESLFLSQKKYAIDILEKAHMVSCNPSRIPVDTESKLGVDGDPVSDPTLYRSLAGSLMYLTFTRPDISYAVQQVCLHMHDPREPHLSALKRILRSTSGYCVFLGNNLLSWSAKRQATLSRSSAEAEYRGVANVVVETCWLKNLLRELHTPLSSATLVYCDNVSAVYLSSNPVQHHRTKHIEIDIHFVSDLVAAGQVRVLHVPFRYQFANIFTKGLPSALFEEFRTSLSVRCPPAPTAGECHMFQDEYLYKGTAIEEMMRVSDEVSQQNMKHRCYGFRFGRKIYFTDGEISDHEGDGEIKVPSSVPVMVRNKGVGDNFERVKPVKLEPAK